MLTDEEKSRIRAEEVFRAEVQKELAANAKNRSSISSRAWIIANSPFGLWFLSAIVLTLITWTFTAWQVRRERAEQNKERIRKLDTEIASRFLDTDIDALVFRGFRPDLPDKVLLAPGPKNMFLEEFSNRNLRSLLDELARLLPENDPERDKVIDALREVETLHIHYAGKTLTEHEAIEFVKEAKPIYDLRWSWTAQMNQKLDEIRKGLERLKGWSGRKKAEPVPTSSPNSRLSGWTQNVRVVIANSTSSDLRALIAILGDI